MSAKAKQPERPAVEVERECLLCGLHLSGCTCNRRQPTQEEIEDAREQRLSRAERASRGTR